MQSTTSPSIIWSWKKKHFFLWKTASFYDFLFLPSYNKVMRHNIMQSETKFRKRSIKGVCTEWRPVALGGMKSTKGERGSESGWKRKVLGKEVRVWVLWERERENKKIEGWRQGFGVATPTLNWQTDLNIDIAAIAICLAETIHTLVSHIHYIWDFFFN